MKTPALLLRFHCILIHGHCQTAAASARGRRRGFVSSSSAPAPPPRDHGQPAPVREAERKGHNEKRPEVRLLFHFVAAARLHSGSLADAPYVLLAAHKLCDHISSDIRCTTDGAVGYHCHN